MYATSLREHFFAIAIFLRVLRTGARQFSFVFYIFRGVQGYPWHPFGGHRDRDPVF